MNKINFKNILPAIILVVLSVAAITITQMGTVSLKLFNIFGTSSNRYSGISLMEYGEVITDLTNNGFATMLMKGFLVCEGFAVLGAIMKAFNTYKLQKIGMVGNVFAMVCYLIFFVFFCFVDGLSFSKAIFAIPVINIAYIVIGLVGFSNKHAVVAASTTAEWVCDECGKHNPPFVGMCSCGTCKPRIK